MAVDLASSLLWGVVGAVCAALILLLFGRRLVAPRSRAERQRLLDAEAELSSLRTANAALEVTAARVPELGKQLNERSSIVETLRDAKAAVDSDLASTKSALEQKTEQVVELRQTLETANTSLEAARATAAELNSKIATLEGSLGQERSQSAEKLKLLTEARENMTKEFKLLANEVMKTHGASFAQQNKEQVEGILKPLRDRLQEFQQGLQVAHTESAKERATLADQIKRLSEQSARMSTETENLTRALKGKAQTQGAWGEMVLSSILERSGLREGEEYSTQESHQTDDGRRIRSDVLVNLPGGQRIVIDSKVSLTAFEECVNAAEDAERVAAALRHVASLKNHIRVLGSKDYHLAAGSELDYVIMFVPIEGALAVALDQDASLTVLAAEYNVAIATPTTLMIALRTVANVWQVERRNRNAEEIASRAGLLYDKFVGFATDMETLGNRLDAARKCYDGAMGKLSTGSGNLVRQVQQLKLLGAKTSKSIPATLQGDSDLEGEPETLEAPDDGGDQLKQPASDHDGGLQPMTRECDED